MAVRKKKRVKKKTPKRFRFQLGFSGVAGIAVVSFCLFLWMFLLGVWAGQTILLPSSDGGKSTAKKHQASQLKHHVSSQVILPEGKKRAVSR